MEKRLKYYKGDLLEYEIYKLVDWYDPILRKPTVPYLFASRKAAEDASYIAVSLSETLEKLGGLGLSANQVGLSHRVCAVNMGSEIWIMFNPTITEQSGLPAAFSEGCLSYPGLYLKLSRPSHIKVRFNAINGQIIEKEFDGLTAVCVQHEIDHLDGKLYTDQVSALKFEQAKRKIKGNLKKLKNVHVRDPGAAA
jgi:peptide deformylase